MPNNATSCAARDLAARLGQHKPMRRGSVSERFVKCSKPGCPCASDSMARHGPCLSLTWAVRGRAQSRLLTPQQAEIARRQIQAGHEFRQHADASSRLQRFSTGIFTQAIENKGTDFDFSL